MTRIKSLGASIRGGYVGPIHGWMFDPSFNHSWGPYYHMVNYIGRQFYAHTLNQFPQMPQFIHTCRWDLDT